MIGIIAEYNPFHYGHLYHLNEVKKMFPDKKICLVLAGHFLNRGEVSVVNKWDKTKVALKYGIDLVVELPFAFATQAADIYAYGAISILHNLKCEYVVFGSESNDIEVLKKLASKKDESSIKKYIKNGFNYPKAMSLVNKDLLSTEINTPNDILGVSYIKAINKLNSNIKPITIKRTNDYHNQELNSKITSASSIRKGLKDGLNIDEFVPTSEYINNININSLFKILKHKIYFENLDNYKTINKDISNLLKKHIVSSNDMDELISKVKNKSNTYNKIKRAIIHILTNFKESDNELKYIRILGYSNKGKNYLNKIKKELNIPIYSNFNSNLQIEYNATFVYSQITNDDILKLETDMKPIYIE